MFKYTFTLLILLAFYRPVQAQADSTSTGQVFDRVDEAPQFPGGMNQWQDYAQKNLRYPLAARKAGRQDRVFVSFVVTQQGHIQEVKALKHPAKDQDPELVQEAVRLIQSMPKWTPGKIGGRAVACRFNMPVTFSLF